MLTCLDLICALAGCAQQDRLLCSAFEDSVDIYSAWLSDAA